MKKNLLGLLIIFVCLNSAYAQNVYKEYVDGRIYIKFSPGSLKSISLEDPRNISLSKIIPLKELGAKYGITKVHKPFYQASDDEILSSILKIEFTQVKKVDAFIDELTRINGAEYAEKVRLNKTDIVPNDPLFATSNGSTHLNQINAQNAWNVFNGNSNITVAIVDNAIMANHADLIGNTYTNTIEASGTTNVDDDGNGYIDDINGYDVAAWDAVTNPTSTSQDHGTHCAGIAGANNNNSIGIASIGWNIKVIPVKCSYDNSGPAVVDAGYEGILYAVKAKAKIISCSWGNSGGTSQTEQYVIDYAWNRGCIIFASAGNLSSSTPNYPGAYNHVYCVASVDPADVKSSFSNYGSWVDISAPGNNILSTVPYVSTAAYIPLSGTSMSTPMVAGLAGLMLSKSPGMTRSDVLNCLSSTAVNIYTIAGNSAYISGSQLGVGRIDAYAAMNCAATFSALPPVANFYAFLPSTCPNVAIPFIDSSLYFPTSWSWTFQGGMPATSTSSNPSVSWSTPGTYSVSLTVSNGNGSNSKTKLSYISVSNAQALPFFEGFQSSAFLPPNWVANNIWNDNLYWQHKTGLGGFGTSTACAMFDNYNMNAPGERDEMRSPKFDFTSVATASLLFDVAYARYNQWAYDSLEVKISTNCGSSWTSIYLNGNSSLATAPDQTFAFVPSPTQWRTEAINISTLTAGQPNVMFSFINRGHYGQFLYLDNINLSFPTPSLGVNNSASICASPAYTFQNTSLSSASYTWNFQGGTPASSTATNPVVSYASPGMYTFSILGVNGTSSATATKTITIVPDPTVSATSGTYCNGSSYTLNGSGAATYTWSSITGPVATSPSLVITPIASTFYTLTGSNGVCSSQGIYTIHIANGPTLSVADQSTCPGSSLILQASGASSYSWSTGALTSAIQVTPSANTVYTVTGFGAMCNTSETVSVTVIPFPMSITSSTNSSCSNSCTGVINATTVVGPGPFTYTLSGSSCTLLPCTGLCPGTYSLLIMNAGLCGAIYDYTITAPAAIQSAITFTDASCAFCPTGVLSANATGGVAPYTYTWSPAGGNSATANNLLPGCYTVTITDANGCEKEQSSCVGFNTGLNSVSLNTALLIYPNPAKNTVGIQLQGLTFDCAVYNNLGQLIVTKKQNQNIFQLDLSTFAKGVYLVEVESGNQRVWRKLLVE